jgi:hypothetical protein
MDIRGALQAYCGSEKCTYAVGADYASLVWVKDNPLPKPTEKQLEEAHKEYVDFYLHNETIDQELRLIDAKKIRALSDFITTGDRSRIDALEQHAALLRQQRRKK